MSFDNLDDTWTTLEAYSWREFYISLFTGISLVFCLFAQALFYISPRLRKFPRSLLSWLNLYNIYFCTYSLARWVPVVPWHRTMSIYHSGTTMCKFNIFLDVTSITGQYVTATLLCFAIFLMVVRNKDLETKRPYFWSFLATTLLLPILVAIPSLLVATSGLPGGPCIIGNYVANKLVRLPFFIMLLLQVLWVGLTMKHIWYTNLAVQNSNSISLPLRLIFVRFIAAVIGQAYNLLPSQYNLTFPEQTTKHAIYIRFAIGTHSTGPLLDALVMIFTNTEFTNWVFRQISELRLRAVGKNFVRAHELDVVGVGCTVTTASGCSTSSS